MKIHIAETGVYELTKVSDIESPQPPIIIPEPEHPKPESNLKELFSNPKLWSKPVEIFEFDEPQGGGFATIWNGKEFVHFQQDRSGGKIRVWTSDDGMNIKRINQRNAFVYDERGGRVNGQLSDVKWYNEKFYGLAKVDKEIYTVLCDDPNADKLRFNIQSHVKINGARDTTHALTYHDGIWMIHGRKRGQQDWGKVDEILMDRRGVRVMYSSEFAGIYTEIHPIDPVKEQSGYATNQMRYDYYSCRTAVINDELVIGISCFAKNSERIPSTRLERKSGTGHIYPIFRIGDEILFHSNTIVPSAPFKRHTTWKEAKMYEPEIGQMYCYGIVFDGKKVKLYFNNRWDTHYLMKKEDNYPNVKVYMIEATL